MFNASKMVFVGGMLALSLVVGCSTMSMTGGKQVAKVNNDVITQQEFDQNYSRILKTMNLDPKLLESKDSQPLAQMFQKITMQNLILESLVAQEAQNRHITVTDEEVKKLYDKHLTRIGGEKVLKEQLDKLHLTHQDFMTELEHQLLKDKLVESLAGNKVAVSESEARSFYNAHPQQFDQPEQVRARHILVSADPKQIKMDLMKEKKAITPDALDKAVQETMAEKRATAEKLYAQVSTSPKAFESVAKSKSDDVGSAKNGGDLGYFAREVMVPPFSQAAFSTKPGEIHKGVVQSQFGYHIIQVMDRKAPEKKTFAEVKDQLMEGLSSQKKGQFMETWVQEAKKKAHIELAKEYDFVKEESAKLVEPQKGN